MLHFNTGRVRIPIRRRWRSSRVRAFARGLLSSRRIPVQRRNIERARPFYWGRSSLDLNSLRLADGATSSPIPESFLSVSSSCFFPAFSPPSSLPRMRRGSSKPARLPPFFCSLGVVSPYIGLSTYERHKANRSESRERFTLLAKNKKKMLKMTMEIQ